MSANAAAPTSPDATKAAAPAAATSPAEGAPAATPAPAKTEGAEATTDASAAEGAAASDEALTSSAPVDPNANLTIRALVSTKEAGVIIGKGGAHVAELREKTGVKAGVSKVVQGVHDRVLSVSGTLEGVSQAYSLIAQTILDNPVSVGAAPAPGTPGADGAAAAPTTTALRLLISHTLMGTVIGRQGLKIKHIQDMSGTRMVASKEMLPSSTERIVEVQGNAESLRVAVNEIGKCLLEDWERGQGTILYTPGQADGAGVLAAGGVGGLQLQGAGVGPRRSGGGVAAGGPGAAAALAPGMAAMGIAPAGAPGLVAGSGVAGPMRRGPAANGVNGGAAGGAGAARGAQAEAAAAAGAVVTPGGGLVAGGAAAANAAPIVDTANNQRTQNISIPSDMVGCIIGKGGSKITEIRRLSGSRISIAKVPHDETGERMFTIQGTPEANEKALFLLYNQLESEKERRTNIVAQEAAAAAAAGPAASAQQQEGEAVKADAKTEA